jgi:hypothetical protein
MNDKYRLLGPTEIIKEGDRIAFPICGGHAFVFSVHPNFHGHPKSDAKFEVGRLTTEK